MEMDNIIKLIQTVSDSTLTSFHYVEGDASLSLTIDRIGTVAKNTVVLEPIISNESTNSDKEIIIKQTITSPMVGTFYSAKSEDTDPFITVGDVIKKGQVIGIVEAMKLMNEIESAYDGVVESILIQNKDMVEYGQPLVNIRPL